MGINLTIRSMPPTRRHQRHRAARPPLPVACTVSWYPAEVAGGRALVRAPEAAAPRWRSTAAQPRRTGARTSRRFTASSESFPSPAGGRDAIARRVPQRRNRLLVAALLRSAFLELAAIKLVDDRVAVALAMDSDGTRITSGTRSVAMRAIAVIPGLIFGSISSNTRPRSKFPVGGHPDESRRVPERRCARFAP